MTDERYQKIMADLGMSNSRSLLQALQQVANEVAQETRAAERERWLSYARHRNDGRGAMCESLKHSSYACTCGLDALRCGPNVEVTGQPSTGPART